MKRSTKSFTKKASSLYQSIHQQISVYAVAVLIVGLFALTQPSEARIVYTPTNIHVDNPYNLDLNQDGITDFTIQQNEKHWVGCEGRESASDNLAETPAQGNGVVLATTSVAAALHPGLDIGSQRFGSGEAFLANVFSLWASIVNTCFHYQGMGDRWVNVSNRYLGLAFQISGKTHYGWARLSVQVGYVYINAKLTGYAYETIAGKSIKAGQKKEATEDPTNEDFGPGASLTSPIPDKPQPASLGMLALGARDVPLWRRKESALEGDLKGAS